MPSTSPARYSQSISDLGYASIFSLHFLVWLGYRWMSYSMLLVDSLASSDMCRYAMEHLPNLYFHRCHVGHFVTVYFLLLLLRSLLFWL